LKEDIRFGYRVRGEYLRPIDEYTARKSTDFIAIHCSATKASWQGGAEQIREWHVHDNGWLDIGYHFVINREGVIERGRPPMAVGSGVQGHNHDTLHICMVGGLAADGKTAESNFTPEQWQTLNFLVHEVSQAYPTAQVKGHRDFPNVKKDCPSFDAIHWWHLAPAPFLGLPVEGETDGSLFRH
jgi:N-acetylmuramoyl-L-alanine amidase